MRWLVVLALLTTFGCGRKKDDATCGAVATRMFTLTREALEKAGKLKRIPFQDRDAMKKLVDPVMEAYAKEIGADKIYAQINAIK